MKFAAHHVAHGFNRLKAGIVSGYNEAFKFAQGLDRGITTAKNIYGVLAPIIDQLSGGRQNAPIMRALSGYEDLRRRAISADTTAREAV